MRFANLFVGLGSLAVIASGAYYVRTHNAYIPYHRIDTQQALEGIHKASEKNFGFKEAAHEMGIDFTFRTPELDPAIKHRIDTYFVGSGTGVADVNGDGFMDIFILAGRQGDKNKLYINQKGEKFIDEAEAWGVAENPPQTAPTHPAFFDATNSGRPDLLLTGAGCSRFYRNTGTRFEEVKDSGLTDCRNSMAGIVLDYDNDGLLDVYVLRYWPEVNLFNAPHYNIYVNNLTNANNGGSNSLYRNLGNGHFEDVTEATDTANTHWSFDANYGDFRDDGKLSLYIANDYGPDSFYEIGKDRWVDVSGKVKRPDRRYGMNTSIIDQGEPNPIVYISNGFLGPPFDITGNFAWQFNHKRARGNEVSIEKNLFNCGFAWGGLAADFNLDGLQDLFVSNGFISNAPRPDAANATISRGDPRGEYNELSARSLPGVVSSDIRKWPDHSKVNAFGWQRDCLFINVDNNGFQNMAAFYKIDEALRDSRSAAGIDIRNDGAISIISKPSKGPVTLYLNQVKSKNWIGFSMVGTKSNRMGAGGRIQITQNKKSQYRWNTAGHSGFLTTSDPRLHFGLTSSKPVKANIRWPSGKTQTFTGLKPGRYYEVKESE